MNGPILLVEDEEDDVFFFKRALKQAGLKSHLFVVQSGQDAIDYLSGRGEFADRSAYPMPGLVILDLKIPHVPGLDVLEWIRKQPDLSPLVVVVWTSSKQEADIVRAYRLGANSYVVKPSSPDKLLDIVKDFSNWWFKHNEPPPRGE